MTLKANVNGPQKIVFCVLVHKTALRGLTLGSNFDVT